MSSKKISPKNITDKLDIPEKNKVFNFIELYEKNEVIKHIPLKEYKKNNIIIFGNKFYSITKILSNNVIEISEIFNNPNNNKEKIKQNNINLKTINNKKIYEKIYEIIDFVIDYNNTINYLKTKKTSIYNLLNDNDINNLIYLKLESTVKINTLKRIKFQLKKTHDNIYEISNLFINPYKFIQENTSYITLNLAEKIEDLWKLHIDFNTKLKAKIISIINPTSPIRNSFYIKKNKFDTEIKNYCNEKNKSYENYKEFIDKEIIIQPFTISKKELEKLGNEPFGFGKEYPDKTRKYVLENNKSFLDWCKDQESPSPIMATFIKYGTGEEIYITTNYLWNLEKNLTQDFLELYYNNKQEYDYDKKEIYDLINEYQEKKSKQINSDFKFDNIQKDSIFAILNNKLSILTGPPGAGKTNILECIFYIEMHNIEEEELSEEEEFNFYNPNNTCIMAPTGQAFNQVTLNVSSKYYNNKISGTCHKVLHNIYPRKCELDHLNKHQLAKKKTFDDWDDNFYKCKFKFIIVDEFSMVDLNICKLLLDVCKKYNSKLLIIGDYKQFEPVGPGNPLEKLINSKMFNVCELKNIYRQASDTNLFQIINKMNKGEKITKEDFNNDNSAIFEDITNLYKNLKSNDILKDFVYEIIDRFALNKDTKFLCYNTNDNKNDDGTDKFIFNVPSLNKIIQDKFNPMDKDNKNDTIKSTTNQYEKREFRINDKIIRTENDYSDENKMRANGEEGYIKDFDGDLVTICYSDDDKPLQIKSNILFEEFDLNYATGFHKSQGGGWKTIVVFIEPNAKFIKQRAIYTSNSRSKVKLILISTPTDLLNCQTLEDKCISLFMDKMHFD